MRYFIILSLVLIVGCSAPPKVYDPIVLKKCPVGENCVTPVDGGHRFASGGNVDKMMVFHEASGDGHKLTVPIASSGPNSNTTLWPANARTVTTAYGYAKLSETGEHAATVQKDGLIQSTQLQVDAMQNMTPVPDTVVPVYVDTYSTNYIGVSVEDNHHPNPAGFELK
jgi:hypothetical protein